MAESKLAYVRTFYMTTTATHASHIQKEVEHGFIFGSGQAAGQQRPHGQEHGWCGCVSSPCHPFLWLCACSRGWIWAWMYVCVSVGAGFAFLFWHPRPLEQRTYKARSVIPHFAHPKTVSNYVWKNYKKKKTREKKRRVAAHWIAMKKFLVISLNNKITVRENSKYFY